MMRPPFCFRSGSRATGSSRQRVRPCPLRMKPEASHFGHATFSGFERFDVLIEKLLACLLGCRFFLHRDAPWGQRGRLPDCRMDGAVNLDQMDSRSARFLDCFADIGA